jgi:hypothetical protein
MPENETWLDPEEKAYNTPTGTHWGSNRRARVVCDHDGRTRIVRCGIPDTYFSIPAHMSDKRVGFIYCDDGVYRFHLTRKDPP